MRRFIVRGMSVGVMVAMVLASLVVRPLDAQEAPAAASQDVLLAAEAGGLVIDLTTPTYQIETVTREARVFQRIALEAEGWWPAGAPGAPSLPERGLMLAVPPSGEVTVQVEAGEAQPVEGVFTLEPAPTASLTDNAGEAELAQQWLADPAAYAAESWMPASPAEITQEGWLRGYRFVRLALRPFQYNPASGELRAMPALRVRVRFAQPAATKAAAADPLFAPVLQRTFANYDQAAGWQARPEPQAIPLDAAQRMTDPWVKVTVNADGLYQVTYADLQAAQVSTAVLNSLNPRTFRLLDQGQEQHIRVLGEEDNVFHTGDSILFYGRRNTDPHSSDNNVYWLTWGAANGQRMAVQSAAPGAAPPAPTLLTTARAEKNLIYKSQRPFTDWLQPVLYDHFYSEQVGQPAMITTTVAFPGLKVNTASTVSPVLSVWMAGDKQTPGAYMVEFTLNNSPAEYKSWNSTRVLDGSLALPSGALVNGDNRVVVRPINVLGVPNLDYTVWLDWLALTYPYSGEYLPGATFSNPDSGVWRYSISNVPTSTPWVLNVGVPTQPKLVTNAAASGSGPYTISWQQTTTAADQYLVTPASEVRQPAAVAVYAPDATLLDPSQQVDYLMIVHSSLAAAVQPLAALHSANGMAVRVVDVQQIYDAFSDGSLSANAIRSYLAYAYSSYQAPAPAYVLLVGDASVNTRGYALNGVINVRPNLIPAFLGGFDAWGGTSISDNGFARVQGNDLLGEMIISRLPVNTPAEAAIVVNKTLNYTAGFPQNRAHSTLWVADNPDDDSPVFGTQFHMASEQTLAPLQPQFQADRVYYCVPGVNNCPSDPWIYTDLSNARSAIVNKWSEGHLLLHFTGHGSIRNWAVEQLFSVNWIGQLNNGAALPFLLVSSCTNGFFASPQYDGMDEGLLRASGRGTIGGFTGVTFDTLPPQTHLLTDFVKAVMQDGITQPGAAATLARARTYATLPYPENERSAVGHGLTGDPALALVAPQPCAPGDLNCDGVINIVDVQGVAGAWGAVAWAAGYNPRADLVRDGRIDVNDIVAVAALWHTPLP